VRRQGGGARAEPKRGSAAQVIWDVHVAAQARRIGQQQFGRAAPAVAGR
jgi:hypothetical protein